MFVLIKLVMEVHQIFTPFIIIIQAVLLPFLLSGFLFYICLPFQKLLEKYKVPRWGSILIIFIVLIALIALVIGVVGPLIVAQVENLISQIPTLQREAQDIIHFALNQKDRLPDDVTNRINNVVKSAGDSVTDILSNSISYITSFISTLFLLIMVPFFLIFMLKDHERFIRSLHACSKAKERSLSLTYLKI